MSGDFARRLLEGERARLLESIRSDLRVLRQRIDIALDSLDAGHRLDAHMIANSVMLTEQIARWNLVRDLLPVVGEESP